ncbi:MAG TPA: zinc-binding dehydrogenase, partial [Myxococcota bacterium]|nr:zinc-binding dehydrogenase [Myxococcota bacterium]
VLVQAAGSGVGSAAVQIARLWGATVIATASTEEKLERARALGAHHVINSQSADVARTVKGLTGGRGVEVVFEHVGPVTWEQSVRALAWQGRLVTCGATTGREVPLNLRHLFFKSLSLLGSTMGSKGEFLEVLSHAARGTLKPVVDRVLPLAEVHQAHALLEQRKVFGKLVLSP